MYGNPEVRSRRSLSGNENGLATPAISSRVGNILHRRLPSRVGVTQVSSDEDLEILSCDNLGAENVLQEVQQAYPINDPSVLSGEQETSTTEIRSADKEDDMALLANTCDTCIEKSSISLLQLKATIQRVLTLKVRRPCGTFFEFIIPIVFIVGTFILWKIIGVEIDTEKDLYSLDRYMQSVNLEEWVRISTCYNYSRTTTPIDGLPICTPESAGEHSIICPHPDGEIPPWFCFNSVIIPTVTSYRWFPRASITSVPSLDTLIMMKWITIAVNGRDDSYWNEDAAYNLYGPLFFAPVSPDTQTLVDAFSRNSRFFRYVYGGTYDVDVVEQLAQENAPIWGILQINEMSSKRCDVTIRLNASALPKTNRVLVANYIGGLLNSTNELYLLSGFLTMQRIIGQTFIQNVTGNSVDDNLAIVQMPTAAYDKQLFLSMAGLLAPLIVVMGFLYPVSQLTRLIVVEKELRIREAMLIMGLSERTMYFAWFIVYLVQYLVTSLLMALVMKLTYLAKTSFLVIFLMLFFFSLSSITLSALLAALFSRARIAALLSPLCYFLFAIPLFVLQNAAAPLKIAVSLLSPSGFAVGISIIFEHELSGGMSISDMTYFRDNPNLLVILGMLLLDTVLYLFLTMYLDAVMPRKWGTPQHPLFCILKPIRWCFGRGVRDDNESHEDGRAPDGVFEDVEDVESSAVRIVGLRKKFKRGGKSFLAVNNLYWGLQEGEIAVLLGHNGAGKSTTMNMITGMVKADGGDCYVYGLSVRHQLPKVRQAIGFCPQHNILWPELTCREHMYYFAMIKGLTGGILDGAVEQLLEAVDLRDKEHTRSSALSGGQKRKLSVGIAFVGGSPLVLLDEPTAGMDVGARRHTWELLKRMAASHTILLTTHFMDEADLLGHRIGIMSKGRLQCSGSSMYLKSKLGAGYLLTLSVMAHADRGAIEALVQSHVEFAKSVSCGAGEVAFRLPMEQKDKFSDLLSDLEGRGNRLSVCSYSLSVTTLEEIFIKLAEGAATHVKKNEDHVDTSVDAAECVWNVCLMQCEREMMWTQFRAMIAKRLWHSLRDRRTQFFQIVCPVACVLLAMLLTLIKLFNSPTLVLSSELYGNGVQIDVANCDTLFNLSLPFSPNMQTVVVPSLTSKDLSAHLLSTYHSHRLERYGAIFCRDPTIGNANLLFYNTSAPHEVAIGLANFFNGILFRANSAALPMVTRVQTLPLTKWEDETDSSLFGILISIVIMIPFTFIPSTFVSWVVRERQCKARHLQNVSGLRFAVYWVSNFVFDLCTYLIMMFLVIIVFAMFNRREYVSSENIGATIVSFLLYGLSGIAVAYLVNFMFNDYSKAQNVVMLAGFVIGFLFVLTVSILSIFEKTEHIADALRWIFRIVPSYCIGECINNMAVLQMQRALGRSSSTWDMDVVGWPCVYMAIETPIFIILAIFIDHPARRYYFRKPFHNPDTLPEVMENEDEDVVRERYEVMNLPERADDLVRVVNLRKVYPDGNVAVRNLTFGVRPGEVFGFLGTNGAGKTTTIAILCQEFLPTSGHAFVCGYDIANDSTEALRNIGYCPQFDACLDLLTVEEHLRLYAGVRGIVLTQRDDVVKGLLRICELTDYRRTLAHELSGGNRRKLSVAISLVGGPRVVFLDEPSAGMDPVARRGLWKAVEMIADNCSIVLTTHHLEEVEVLAHRVAIMVDGRLRCIGDKTHLKNKYGSGYEVTVRLDRDVESVVADVKAFFYENFPGSSPAECRSNRMTFALPRTTRLSLAFELLERNHIELGLSDYQISQTSIEQVFLRISEEANRAREEEETIRLAAGSTVSGKGFWSRFGC